MLFGVNGADVDGVGLPALPQAEAEFSVLCDQPPCLAGHEKKKQALLHQFTLTFPPVKQRHMTGVCG